MICSHYGIKKYGAFAYSNVIMRLLADYLSCILLDLLVRYVPMFVVFSNHYAP